MVWSQDKGGRWQFEGNGDDTADWDTQNDTGNLQGAATYSNIDPAEGESCLWLTPDAINDYFRIDDSDDLDFTDEDIGISMWIYPVIINEVHFLVNKGDQYPVQKTTNYSLRISNDDRLEFLVRVNNVAQNVASSFTIPVNQWTFIAAFYDYSAGKVYMWNSLTSTPTDTLDFNQPLIPNNDPLSIGAWYRSDPEDPAHRDFNGRMDDVRISGSLENILPVTAGIENHETPFTFDLKQNYPNPFNPKTTITYELHMTNEIELSIYNLLGQKIVTLVSAKQQPGTYSVEWDASGLASGIYIYRLESNSGYSQTRKMVLYK